MILLIDNYDSFSYNLYQLIGSMDPDIRVIRNDYCKASELENMDLSAIILSPGPGRPCDAGICEDVVREYSGRLPILGVCLGHQAICEASGAKITYAKELMHGKQSEVRLRTGSPLFNGMPETILAGRYHSLAVDPDSMPGNLKPIAASIDGDIMAVNVYGTDTYGIQFHPESIMTPAGGRIIRNFLNLRK